MDRIDRECSAPLEVTERLRNHRPGRGEARGGVEQNPGVVLRSTRPDGAHLERELAMTPRAREDEDVTPRMPRDLQHEMGGSAESEEPELPAAFDSGKLERPITDHPGAEERRRLCRRKPGRKPVDRTLGRGHPLGVPSIPVASGEARAAAKVLASGDAERAHTAGRGEPAHADDVARPETLHSAAAFENPSGDLVSGHDRQRRRDLAFREVNVRPADAARLDLDRHFPDLRPRLGSVARLERLVLHRRGPLEDHGSHRALFSDGKTG